MAGVGVQRPTHTAPVLYPDHVVDTSTLDSWPLTVRGPIADNSSGVVTFARMFVYDGRLYIAQSGNKGKDIRSVTSYPLPEEPVMMRGSKAGRWGPWKWSGCGCSSRWNTWSKDQLVALDQTETPAQVDA